MNENKKLVNYLKPSRKLHSTVGERLETMAVQLCAWVHQLTETLASVNLFNGNWKRQKSIRTLLLAASSEPGQELSTVLQLKNST